MKFDRYAIYHSFAPAPWSDWAAGWLGWDMSTGRAAPPPHDLPLDPEPLTRTPRRYGLHATLKPPFRLASGQTPDALRIAFAAFCADHAPVPVGRLRPVALGRFLALMPQTQPTELTDLAGRIVRGFDRFRAPLTDAELTRRRAARLSSTQEDNLLRWGYPHVMDAFRYHITLTDRLGDDTRAMALPVLDAQLAPRLPHCLMLDALSLAGEDTEGRFHVLARHPLTG